MSDKTLSWLLEEDNPSVRFFALTDLERRPKEDPSVMETKKIIMEKGIVPKILGKQNPDGSWGIAERFYRDKYKGTVWSLLVLAEMVADPNDQRVRNACEFILEHSQDPEGGGFSYDQSAKNGTGMKSCVIPCLTGNMVYALIKLGYLHDVRVQKAIEWITRYQRADDGILEAPTGEYYDRYKTCYGRHSCHMGVAKALKALAAIPQDDRREETTAKMDELLEYFLKHHLYKRSHDLNAVSRPGWLKLGFPLMYQTDILELLGIFTNLGISDPRLEDAREIIRSKRMDDGKWKLESTMNGKMNAVIEQKGMPSKWITLKALKVMNN